MNEYITPKYKKNGKNRNANKSQGKDGNRIFFTQPQAFTLRLNGEDEEMQKKRRVGGFKKGEGQSQEIEAKARESHKWKKQNNQSKRNVSENE